MAAGVYKMNSYGYICHICTYSLPTKKCNILPICEISYKKFLEKVTSVI